MKRSQPTERVMCETCGKRLYSQNDATKMARHMNHDQARDWPVGPYVCPEGGRGNLTMHLGHVRRKALRRNGRRVR